MKINHLLGYIKSLMPHLDKDAVLEDARVTKSELELTVIPAVRQAAEHFKVSKIESLNVKNLSTIFFRNYDLAKASSNVNIASEIYSKLPIVSENLGFIEKEFESIANPDILTEAITAKKAILIRALDQMSFISRYTLDLLTYIYTQETIAADPEAEGELDISKNTTQRVIQNIATYASLLTTYGNKNFMLEKRLDKIPEVLLSEKTADSVVSTFDADKLDPLNTPFAMNFFYNPIYHVRLVIAEWQASRYKANKDKKKMLELRLLYLKMLSDDKKDASVQKEIAYTQERIDSLEYSMKKMERSVE